MSHQPGPYHPADCADCAAAQPGTDDYPNPGGHAYNPDRYRRCRYAGPGYCDGTRQDPAHQTRAARGRARDADPSRAMVDPYQRHAFTPSDDNPEVCAFDLAAAAHHRPAPR